jgi:hypothetical protein
MSKQVSSLSETDPIPKIDTTLIGLSHGAQVEPTQCIPEVMTSSAFNNSSIQGSPARDPLPLESSALTSQKKKKKKKSKKPKTLDTADSPAGKLRTTAPSPDFERASVLCISRNKHWKYISSYHVIVPYTFPRQPN